MSHAIEQFGNTQQKLLRHVMRHPDGVAVEALAEVLGISANAARQHVTVLERDGYLERGDIRPTGRRPRQLYCLSEQGKDLFPKRYNLLADLLIQQVRNQIGAHGLSGLMRDMGIQAGTRLTPQAHSVPLQERLIKLVDVMTEIGYEAHQDEESSSPAIIAHNCVFHHLAAQSPEVCEFDLALMETATGMSVQHVECMVRGGKVCRFELTRANPVSPPPIT